MTVDFLLSETVVVVLCLWRCSLLLPLCIEAPSFHWGYLFLCFTLPLSTHISPSFWGPKKIDVWLNTRLRAVLCSENLEFFVFADF